MLDPGVPCAASGVKDRAGSNDAGVEASVAFRDFAALCAYSAMTFTRPAAPAASRGASCRIALQRIIASLLRSCKRMLVPEKRAQEARAKGHVSAHRAVGLGAGVIR
jgi:hypothetical protein